MGAVGGTCSNAAQGPERDAHPSSSSSSAEPQPQAESEGRGKVLSRANNGAAGGVAQRAAPAQPPPHGHPPQGAPPQPPPPPPSAHGWSSHPRTLPIFELPPEVQHGQSAHVGSMGGACKVPTLAAPERGSCGSSGRTWRLWAARHSQGRGQATGHPATASGVIERTASPVADSLAFDHCRSCSR